MVTGEHLLYAFCAWMHQRPGLSSGLLLYASLHMYDCPGPAVPWIVLQAVALLQPIALLSMTLS